MTVYIGIDPGTSGGIATIEEDEIVAVPMPTVTILRAGKKRKTYDHKALFFTLGKFRTGAGNNCYGVLEEQHPIHGQGLTSTCSICYGFGALRQCLVDLEIPHDIVRAKEWQKSFGISGKKGNTKEQALHVVQELFPDVNLLATTRSKKPHEGMIDALLICAFGKRQNEKRKTRDEML